MDSLGSYLRDIRKLKGLSMKDVFLNTGITDSRLSKIENNFYQEPSPNILLKLANYYSLDIIDLYVRAGYFPKNNLYTKQLFHNTEKLTSSDIKHIQNEIDYLVSKQI